MSITPKKPCRRCHRALTTTTYCITCQPIVDARQKATSQKYDDRRGKTAARGYDAQWNKVRLQAKAEGMWVCQCDRCSAMERTKVVTKPDPVHHIKPIETHPELRLEMSNLVSMTRVCHEATHRRFIDKEFEEWERGKIEL